MRVGILFPVVIFITAILFLAWFFIGGYAAPRSITMRKTTMVLMGIALIAAAGTELGWW